MGLFSKKGGKEKQGAGNKDADADAPAASANAPAPSASPPESETAPLAPKSSSPSGPILDNRGAEMRFTVFGKILSMMGRQKPFADMPLAQVASMIGPAIEAGQFAIADRQSKDQTAPAVPMAFILWARVSEEVDKKLSENLDQPAALTPQDFTSGDIPWLILSVGPQQAIAAILKAVSAKLPEGKAFKMRFTGKDGQQQVGFVSVEERPPEQTY
jgi:hemolysin-activating ACP:hemolysin acyltransferase